jgi:RNA polymerase sigma-70 factor (ECF subfamily)
MDRTQDRQLIAGLQAGNQAAVTELAERYGPRIHQLAMRYMKNHEDAEEVTQDVLLKVHLKIDAFRGDAALSSWMSRLRQHRAARVAAQDRDRVEALHEAAGEQTRTPKEPADWSRMPDEQLMRAQLLEAFAAAVQELPEIYRAPVVLRDIQGLTTEEASVRLKLKDQTLKSRLHRGRLLLRERLDAFKTGLALHRPSPAYS